MSEIEKELERESEAERGKEREIVKPELIHPPVHVSYVGNVVIINLYNNYTCVTCTCITVLVH